MSLGAVVMVVFEEALSLAEVELEGLNDGKFGGGYKGIVLKDHVDINYLKKFFSFIKSI